MSNRLRAFLPLILLFSHGCFHKTPAPLAHLTHRATGQSPEVLALYEAWFGHPKHISVGYSTQDPAVLKKKIHQAQAIGISAFVVDWYGDREPDRKLVGGQASAD